MNNQVWTNTMIGQTWLKVGSSDKNKSIAKIESNMKSFGDGARAIIVVVGKNRFGHAFNIENVGGKIRYIDAQCGREYNIKSVLSQAQPQKTLISRIDNLAPNPVLLDKAIERK